jgi:two-component system, NarL family, nitrate/nitrite response regulator NarL
MTDDKRFRIKVFIIDDHPIVRDGVRAYLSGMRSIDVVGEAANDEEALRRVKRLSPNVIVVDVSLPGLDGGELTRRLRQMAPKAKVVAFSMHSGQEYVVRMARCGVHGYVMKGEPTARLVDAIVRVSQGGLYFPTGMTDAVLSPGSSDSDGGTLTPREREVLSLLSEGLANKQVAGRLGISVRTAETHRERLSHKLNILTVAGLTKYAIQHGLTSLRAAA